MRPGSEFFVRSGRRGRVPRDRFTCGCRVRLFNLRDAPSRPLDWNASSSNREHVGTILSVHRRGEIAPLGLVSAHIRQARPSDAAAMHRVRMSVQENKLVSVALSERDYLLAVTETGRGWVVEWQGGIVAFAIGNSESGSIWALFTEPGHEGQGYGRQLHDIMVAWLWEQGHRQLWLTTEPGTRAERFYRAAGWTRIGEDSGDEVRFGLEKPGQT